MKKISLFFALAFLLPGISHAYPKALDAILPPEALYEKEISQAENKRSKESQTRFPMLRNQTPTRQHIFTTDRSFKEVKDFFKTKGILLKNFSKKKRLENLKNQEPNAAARQYEALLKDPDYHRAFGRYQEWLIVLSSHPITRNQKQGRITIIFTKSVPRKEGAKKEINSTLKAR